jgi:dTDP-L-rhamnose 4-epimerase
VFEDGGQRRDFVHVHDVAQANLLALTAAPTTTGPFNVASGEVSTVLELAEGLAAAHAGAPAPVVTGQWRAGDVRHVFASPRRAAELLGFEARTPLARGLSELAGAGAP